MRIFWNSVWAFMNWTGTSECLQNMFVNNCFSNLTSSFLAQYILALPFFPSHSYHKSTHDRHCKELWSLTVKWALVKWAPREGKVGFDMDVIELFLSLVTGSGPTTVENLQWGVARPSSQLNKSGIQMKNKWVPNLNRLISWNQDFK